MKKLLIGALAGCLLLTFYPTDHTRDEVVTLYTSLASYSAEQSAVLNSFQIAKEMQDNIHAVEVSDLGKAIAEFGCNIAEKLGNGVSSAHASSFFKYSLSTSGHYDTYQRLYDNVTNHLKTGSPDTCHISCCAFATFCVQTFTGLNVYHTSCRQLRDDVVAEGIELKGDGTIANLKEIAEPGDIILVNRPNGDKPWPHAILWVGAYNAWEDAIVHSSRPIDNKDVVIIRAYEEPDEDYYLIKLSDLMAHYNLSEEEAKEHITEQDLVKELDSYVP